MERCFASNLVNEFFRDMNPGFWNGTGSKPSSFSEGIWEYPLNGNEHLEITFAHDDTDGWHHFCDIVDTKSNDSIDQLSGYGIDSPLNLVDTVMDLCRNYGMEVV